MECELFNVSHLVVSFFNSDSFAQITMESSKGIEGHSILIWPEGHKNTKIIVDEHRATYSCYFLFVKIRAKPKNDKLDWVSFMIPLALLP